MNALGKLMAQIFESPDGGKTIKSRPAAPVKPAEGQIARTQDGLLVYKDDKWVKVDPPAPPPPSPRWDLIEEYPELGQKYQEYLEVQKHYEAWYELMKRDEAADTLDQGTTFYYAPYIPIKKG